MPGATGVQPDAYPAHALPGIDRQAAADLLEKLRKAHAEIENGFAAMDAALASSVPDAETYSRARWKLSSASRMRRALASQICAELRAGASSSDLMKIKALADGDTLMLQTSAAHVRTWTSGAIEADWIGYRAASIAIRLLMKERIRAEQAVLLPLLQRAAGR